MKIERIKTMTSFVFLVVAFVFTIMLTQGFSLTLDKLNDITFWTLILIDMAFMLICYNVYFDMDNGNRMNASDSRYKSIWGKYQANIDKFYKSNTYYEKLDEAITNKNAQYLMIEQNKYIHKKGSCRLTMNDFENIKTIGEVEEICKGKLLDEKSTKKVTITMQKIFNGDITSEKIDIEDILIDKVGDKHSKDGLLFNKKKFHRNRNINKVSSFLITTIILASISYAFQSSNMFETVLSKLTLIGTSVIAAMFNSKKYVHLRQINIDEKNHFLEMHVFEETE